MLERDKYAANYRCRLFSRNTGRLFLDYLKWIEAEADILGGQLKTGNLWTAQNRQFSSPAETL
jgi:hypothetical protein